MAKSFNDTNGEAKKGGTYYKYKEGTQTLRLVGQIMPRYSYWKNSTEGKPMSVECLSFDRDLEKFTNVEKDWFQHHFPDINCSWSYVGQIIDPEDDTKTILIPLKKKFWQQVETVAGSLGDPTNSETGWDLVLTKAKTGAHAFNVEYTVEQLKCKVRPLNENELQAVADMPSLDTLVPRPTPEEQKAFIEKAYGVGNAGAEIKDENMSDEDQSAMDEQDEQQKAF